MAASEKSSKPGKADKLEADAPAEAGKGARFYRVRALRPGFRRGGRAWSVQAEVINAADFSDAQLAQMLNEPLLVVTEVSLAEAKAAAAAMAEAG